jgi:FHA domain-containing protein/type VI secretion system protein
VLPDPERHISRTHATIAFQASGFVITDSGTKNPIILNGRPMGPGVQMRLGDGDQMKIGGYELQVSLAPRGASQMPPVAARADRMSGTPKDDPLAAFGDPWSKPPDPFADLLPVSRPDSGHPEPRVPRPDPVADLQGPEPSIDEVVGDVKSAGADPLGVGPQPGRVFLPPDAMDPVDPLEARGGVRKPIPPPTIPDHDQELKSHYVPPKATLDIIVEPKPEIPPAPPLRPRGPAPSVELPTPSPSRAAPDRVETAPLLRALLTGAGIPDADQPKILTPELMEAVGGLLREAVQGTLDLLHARGLMKSEMRADVT